MNMYFYYGFLFLGLGTSTLGTLIEISIIHTLGMSIIAGCIGYSVCYTKMTKK